MMFALNQIVLKINCTVLVSDKSKNLWTDSDTLVEESCNEKTEGFGTSRRNLSSKKRRS